MKGKRFPEGILELITGVVTTSENLGPYESSIGVLLADRTKRFQSKPCFAEKRGGCYESTSWTTLWSQVQNIGAHFLELGLEPGDRVAVLSENRGEMLLHDLAGMSAGLVVVPIFSGYFAEQVHFILNHAEPRVITVSYSGQFEKVRSWSGFEKTSRVYAMETRDILMSDRVRPFSELMDPIDPAAFESRVAAQQPGHPCLIMYTSGTTGLPKGVVLTHKNILSQQKGVSQLWDVNEQDTFLSYLPWHHSFGGLFERFMALYQGATLFLDDSRGKNISLMLENMKAVQPTVFFSVPKVYQALVVEADHDAEIEHVIFHPRLRFVFTAAAPLSDEVSKVFERHGIPVHEGWGLTETSPDITLTRPGYHRVSGIVGWPIPGVEVQVAEDGEILAKGPNIMKEYYRDPELTRQVMDQAGWFHTGDLGAWTDHGLRIVGRVDGIFKLSNAEKVCPDRIEKAALSASRLILQCVAVGSGRDEVGLLMYLNWREVERRWKGLEAQQVVEHPDLHAQLSKDLLRANEELEVKYERVNRFMVLTEELTLERGELTPTMKVVRRKVLEHFQWAVQALYEHRSDLVNKNVVLILGAVKS